MYRIVLGFMFLCTGCGLWFSKKTQHRSRSDVYQNNRVVVTTPVQGIPGNPEEWICAAERPDSVQQADFSRRQFGLKWKWNQQTWTMAGFSDESLHFYRKPAQASCISVNTFPDLFTVAEAHTEDVNLDGLPELWVIGYEDEAGNRPGALFFLQNQSVQKLDIPLSNPEKLQNGNRIVSRHFQARCEVSEQKVYSISANGQAHLQETLYFYPDCKSDSAKAVLTYQNGQGQSTELPIIGTRRMVFDIFRTFYE